MENDESKPQFGVVQAKKKKRKRQKGKIKEENKSIDDLDDIMII